MGAVHTFASVFGQQGRVNIDDLSRVSLNQQVGDLPKKPCQYNEVTPAACMALT